MTRGSDLLFEKIVNKIRACNNIYLASHIEPDGDNIGSLLALGIAIRSLNKNVGIIKVDNIPKEFEFLPDIESIKEHEYNDNIELFISLDCSDIERLGIARSFMETSDYVINIDHHITNDMFGDINLVIPNASSTGEIIYYLIKKMNITLDKDIATCLYTAISSDTGNFMYDNTTESTHIIAAELLSKDIDLNNITVNLYQSRSLEKTNLFIKALNNLKLYENGEIGIVKISRKILDESKAEMQDSDGIVGFIRDIDGVEVACILKEYGDKIIKVSMRSKKYVDVSKICLKFNGGGHVRAAGCTIKDNLNDAEKRIIREIKRYIR